MRIISPVALGLFATCCLSGPLWAENIPLQLRDKTISATWEANWRVMTHNRGEMDSPDIHVKRVVYVSGAGRFFTKSTFNSRSFEVAPEQMTGARQLKFSDGKLIGTARRGQGAGRMVISFDPAYASCTVHLLYGIPKGQHVVFKNRRGVTVELLGARFSAETCSIHNGNAFANR